MKIYLFIFLFLGMIGQIQAQEPSKTVTVLERLQADTLPKPSVLDKKMYWGFTFLNGLSSVTNNADHFYKPSIGAGLKIDYYFTKSIGLSLGAAYQQRGTGVLTPDLDKSLGNADSTHRLRIRFNCLELPLALIYRSSKGLFGGNGVRFVGGVGITPSFNFQTNRFFNSAEDGFHDIRDVSSDYYRFDASLDGNAGFLISAGGASVFLVDLLAQFGTQNTYRNSPNSGQNRYVALRMAWLF